jgi:peptidoglycan hydrolase CwlO-like protein
MRKYTSKASFFVFCSVAIAFVGLLFVESRPVAAEESADEIESDISKLEKKLKKEQADLNALQQDLGQINSSLTSTQQLIQRTQALLTQTAQTIDQKESEITNLENQLSLEKKVLRGLLQELYFSETVPLAEVMLDSAGLSELLQGKDNLLSTQEKMQEVIRSISDMKAKVLDEKASLEETKQDHEALIVLKNKQKQVLVAEKIDVEDDLEEQQATVAELQSKLNELKSDLNELLGGSYNAKNIKDAIKFASGKTGVREGFLFGMLSVESRLGASVGGCDYKQSRMSAYRLGIFKEIASELDLDYKKLKVSCPPRSYKGTGGAMGAAQFMSDTWKGYKSTIASRTGHNPPNPWNLTDGVMAMASKLSNDGGAKDGTTTITSPCTGKKVKVKWETVASMKYLGWSCYALNNYSKTIQSLSGNYKSL